MLQLAGFAYRTLFIFLWCGCNKNVPRWAPTILRLHLICSMQVQRCCGCSCMHWNLRSGSSMSVRWYTQLLRLSETRDQQCLRNLYVLVS